MIHLSRYVLLVSLDCTTDLSSEVLIHFYHPINSFSFSLLWQTNSEVEIINTIVNRNITIGINTGLLSPMNLVGHEHHINVPHRTSVCVTG